MLCWKASFIARRGEAVPTRLDSISESLWMVWWVGNGWWIGEGERRWRSSFLFGVARLLEDRIGRGLGVYVASETEVRGDGLPRLWLNTPFFPFVSSTKKCSPPAGPKPSLRSSPNSYLSAVEVRVFFDSA